MSEKYVVTWDMLQIHARKLASRLMPSEQWKGIIAVSRGGLVPGALLARELGIRKAHFVTIFAKPAGRPLVDDYVIDIPQNTWIEQPWDMGVVFVPPISGR